MNNQLFKDPLLNPASFYLDTLNLDTDFKDLLKEIITEEDLSPDDFDEIKQFIEYIQQRGGFHHKKLLFLFSNPEQVHCFDQEVLHYHRINAISDLFYKDYGIFNGFLRHILPDVKKYAEVNADFRKKYERTKRENKKKSSVKQRMRWYLSNNYALELIAEFEDIPLEMLKYELMPFWYWGKDIYQAAYNAIYGDTNYDAIPRWSKTSNAWLPFLGMAAMKKDAAMTERIFENVDVTVTIRILVNVFYNRTNEYEQTNWLDIAIRNDFFNENEQWWQGLHERLTIIPSPEKKAAVFLKLIGNKIQRDDTGQALEAIQLFFSNLIVNPLDQNIPLCLKSMSGRAYQRFIKIIAEKAASYPPGNFLNWHIFKNYAGSGMEKMVLDFLKEYISLAQFDDKEDILLLGQFLYNVMDNRSGYNRENFDNVPEYVGFDAILLPYIGDTEFVLQLLAIPGTFKIEPFSEYLWPNKLFTFWFLRNHAEYQAAPVWPLDSNSYPDESTSKAAALLLTPSAGIRSEPEILDIIWRYFRTPGIIFQSDFIPCKYFIRVNTDPEKDSALLEAAARQPSFDRIELNVIRYIKLHGGFDFIDFSLNYNSIEDIVGFSLDVFTHHKIEKLALCLLYLKKKGDSFDKVQKIVVSFANKLPPVPVEPLEYFDFFFNEAINEKDGEFFKLYIFTVLYYYINFDIQRLLKDMPHETEIILDRCRKHLATLRKIETDKLSTDEVTYYHETSFNAAWLLAKTVSCWKGIKPLLLAFRNTKRVLLGKRLYPLTAEENIAATIFRLLNHKLDDEKLKQLRRDMADEFCGYLKTLPPKDRGDPRDRERNYTKTERSLKGFDAAYREPNPLWRYAYARALADLGVDVDGKGHCFHSTLEKAAENDPSPAVREAAGKTAEYLRRLRDGWEEGSHKRHLIQAYWWLRRAHVLTIDERLYNEQEALKARISEFR